MRKCGVMLKEPGENESHNGSSDATLLNIMKVKSTVKSYALIISVSDYPHLWKPKLQAAEVDYNNLKDFFSGNQEFDVVVGLRDAMVSEHNIRFILRNLIGKDAGILKNSRLVVAITGHGFDDKDGSYLALSATDTFPNDEDEGKSVSLKSVREMLNEIQGNFFHVLLLVNVCKGADLFGATLAGENEDVPSRRSVRAVTAGYYGDDVYASPDHDPAGSLFFDTIIYGVESGEADPGELQVWTDAQGKETFKGFVRLGALETYLTTRMERLNAADPSKYSDPLKGSILDFARGIPLMGPEAATGGAFFVVPLTTTISKEGGGESVTKVGKDSGAYAIPAGPISALNGRPDIKVFNPIDQYPVRGLNVSSSHGEPLSVICTAFGRVDFIYARAANGVTGEIDSQFGANWQKYSGVARGAYFVLSYCRPLADQLSVLRQAVPLDSTALPLAVDAEFRSSLSKPGPFGDELKCGAAKGDSGRKEWIASFADAAGQMYRKTPVIYGNAEVFAGESSERLDRFSIWFADDSKDGLRTHLPGRNPWTIWQYAPNGYLQGTKTEAGPSVFFGTPQQFEAFARGDRNEALAAATADSAIAKNSNQGTADGVSDWKIPTGNLANTRYSELTQINTENVHKLAAAWTFSTGVLRGHEGGPLVIGDVMYLHAPFPNTVFALDLNNDGKIFWKYEPKQDPNVIPVMCCDTVNRGVSLMPTARFFSIRRTPRSSRSTPRPARSCGP